ncbi:MAG TPA: hypothetical protein VHA80_09070 [Solirubrobacterales bacterium]|nr:hypothetical protein [Solirubrobacterales bacterium]
MTRLVPDLPADAGISREEVAMWFCDDDTDEGMRIFNEAAREIPFSMRTNSETGEAEYRLSDIEAIVQDWKGERRAPRRPTRPSAPAPVTFADDDAGLDAVLLSADAGGKSTKGIRVADAAKQAGLTEEEMSARLLGSVQLRVVDGDLCVGLDDLNRLRKEGVITKVTSTTEPATSETIDNPLAPVTDPQVEARTEAVARELGIDLSPATSSTTDDAPKVRQAGAILVTADDDEGYRLGKPRRWGQT